MAKEFDLKAHQENAENKINEILSTLVGDYLYQELVTVIQRDLLKPLIQAGIINTLSHIELYFESTHFLNIPLGGSFDEDKSNPIGTVIVADSPYETVRKTARRLADTAEGQPTHTVLKVSIVKS